MGKITNRESLAFSEHGQLSQAIPQFHVERITARMNANRAIRIAAERTQGLWGLISVLWERYVTANER